MTRNFMIKVDIHQNNIFFIESDYLSDRRVRTEENSYCEDDSGLDLRSEI